MFLREKMAMLFDGLQPGWRRSIVSCLLALIMLSCSHQISSKTVLSWRTFRKGEPYARLSVYSQGPWANLPFYDDRSEYSESFSYLFFIKQYRQMVFQQQKPTVVSFCVHHICWMCHFLLCLIKSHVLFVMAPKHTRCWQLSSGDWSRNEIKSDQGQGSRGGVTSGYCLWSRPFQHSSTLKEQERMWPKLLEHLLHSRQ